MEARFTKSEIIVLCWNSREQYHKMSKKFGEKETKTNLDLDYEEPELPKPKLKKRKADEEKQLDLSKMHGKDIVQYFQRNGINFPMIMKKANPKQGE